MPSNVWFSEVEVRAILWKLGVLPDSQNHDVANWSSIQRNVNFNSIVKVVARELASRYGYAIRLPLGDLSGHVAGQNEVVFLQMILTDLARLVNEDSFTSMKVAGIIEEGIRQAGVRSQVPSRERVVQEIRGKLGMTGEKDLRLKPWEVLTTGLLRERVVDGVADAFAETFNLAFHYRLDARFTSPPSQEVVRLCDRLLSSIVGLSKTHGGVSERIAGIVRQGLSRLVFKKSPAPGGMGAMPKPQQAPVKPAPPRYPNAQPAPYHYPQLPSPGATQPAPPPKPSPQAPAAAAPKPSAPQPSSTRPAQPTGSDMNKLGPTPDNKPTPKKDEHEQYAKDLKAQEAAMGTAAGEGEKPATDAPAAPVEASDADSAELVEVAAPPAPAAAAGWRYLPIPDDQPEPHTEYDARDSRSPQGMPIIGARVRGKKHKHDGTNCDDSFETAVSGNWTILAVADGGGSAKFARLGSKAACSAAVDYLREHLNDHEIKTRDDWNDAFTFDPATALFNEKDLAYVQTAMHDAFRAACDAIKGEVKQRQESEEHTKFLGKPIEFRDLYTTLLIAIHLPITIRDVKRDLIFACAVGDGMVSVILEDGSCRLLMTPDSGEFSGETEFLTEKIVEQAAFPSRVRPFIGPMRAILSMTDGVSDDYFPNEPGMALLYADLILNGIVPVKASDEEIDAALAATQVSREELKVGDVATGVERVTSAAVRQQVPIRTVAALAQRLKLDVDKLIASPALLAAGRLGRPLCDSDDPKERLQVWLDSYHVRGSFDDRTLVVLHREPQA
ncbi:MAG: protein phosphatase 2C domain-containing protein [Phycisphaeraceae bacterium]